MASGKISAGLLMYRWRLGELEVLLAHPGGPLFSHKDEGAWSIPKGEVEPGEDLLKRAEIEFAEELGVAAVGPFIELGWVKQKGGKVVHGWALEGDFVGPPRSNSFAMEWPPRSGQCQSFPEIDCAEFFALPAARRKINPAQCGFLDRLLVKLAR